MSDCPTCRRPQWDATVEGGITVDRCAYQGGQTCLLQTKANNLAAALEVALMIANGSPNEYRPPIDQAALRTCHAIWLNNRLDPMRGLE